MDTATLIATGVYGGLGNKSASCSFTVDVPLTRKQTKAIRYVRKHGGEVNIKVRFIDPS